MRNLRLIVVLAALLVVSGCLTGCKNASNYTGTYKIVMTPQLRQVAEAIGKLDNRADAGNEMENATVILNADGSYVMSPIGTNPEQKGAFKVQGNKIMCPATRDPGSSTNGTDMTFIFDEKEHTLTGDFPGMKLVYKKQ